MKLSKILSPILAVGGVAAAVTPFTVLTSCSKSTKWVGNNFVEVLYAGKYEPIVESLKADSSLNTDEKLIQAYLNNIKNNGQILKDDLCYSANLLQDDEEVEATFGEGREGIYKFQWNIGDVEVDVDKSEINYTLGVYMSGTTLGWNPAVVYNKNCFKNINLYMEIRRAKPLKIVSIGRDNEKFKTNDVYLTLKNTDTKNDGDLLTTEYQLKMFGTFWYYSDISELIKYENVDFKKTLNTEDEMSTDELAFTQIANRFTFCFTQYLLNSLLVDDLSQIYIASNYLSNFKKN